MDNPVLTFDVFLKAYADVHNEKLRHEKAHAAFMRYHNDIHAQDQAENRRLENILAQGKKSESGTREVVAGTGDPQTQQFWIAKDFQNSATESRRASKGVLIKAGPARQVYYHDASATAETLGLLYQNLKIETVSDDESVDKDGAVDGGKFLRSGGGPTRFKSSNPPSPDLYLGYPALNGHRSSNENPHEQEQSSLQRHSAIRRPKLDPEHEWRT